MADVIDVTDATFDTEVLNSDLPVFIDFWSETCPPCRAIAPIIKELAEEYDGRVKVVKVNTMENQATAARYQVMSIPTLLTIKGGQVIGQTIGAKPKSAFVQMIDELLT